VDLSLARWLKRRSRKTGSEGTARTHPLARAAEEYARAVSNGLRKSFRKWKF